MFPFVYQSFSLVTPEMGFYSYSSGPRSELYLYPFVWLFALQFAFSKNHMHIICVHILQ